MTDMELSLNPTPTPEPAEPKKPVVGYIAVSCGLSSILVSGLIFCPLGLITAVVALFMREFFLGISALLLTAVGFITTPIFLAYLGWKAFSTYTEGLWSEFLKWVSVGLF
ncbi:MAG: hypothetical protein HOK61_12830 [Alphaproteobacteria bacterium]|jgi:hypothetical protein|nr:hypothetical protein [Alphaproteobacteria bacterium]MBT7769436.1 hypothetical protein [Rhodospirillales bacterium]